MTVKIAEIQIDQKTLDAIYRNWNQHSFVTENSEILDETNRLLVNLRVPYLAKGEFNHMTISTEVKTKQVRDRIALRLFASIVKPLIISLVTGTITYFFFFFTDRNYLFTVLIAVLISGAYFTYFYAQLVKTGRRFLRAMKEQSANNCIFRENRT